MEIKEQQEYMDRLWSRIMSLYESDPDNQVMLPAMLSNYQSKIAIGWPNGRKDAQSFADTDGSY